MVPHLSGYQARDREVVDYRMAELANTGLQFRDPAGAVGVPEYFACVGAAQTFGCFTPKPFADLLAADVGLPALNLGYGGAGPEFFVGQKALIPHLNSARFVVLQVMSGRSQSNSLYHCGGLEFVVRRSDGARLGAQRAIFEHMLPPPSSIAGIRVPTRLRQRLPNPGMRARLEPLVAEIRAAWVESYRRLLEAIEVPVVLFWFSKRKPDYVESYEDVASLLGPFPQLVDQKMVETVAGWADHYIECVTDNGSPQPLTSRFTGEPVEVDPADDRPDLGGTRWTHNLYYPSPEMHEDAAAALRGVCRQLATRSDQT